MKKIKILCFGEFRTLSASACIELDCENEMSIKDVRFLFLKTLKSTNRTFDEKLFNDSVFATEDGVLKDSDLIYNLEEIAVLPPVCGG